MRQVLELRGYRIENIFTYSVTVFQQGLRMTVYATGIGIVAYRIEYNSI